MQSGQYLQECKQQNACGNLLAFALTAKGYHRLFVA
jgi:hypothetical protein